MNRDERKRRSEQWKREDEEFDQIDARLTWWNAFMLGVIVGLSLAWLFVVVQS